MEPKNRRMIVLAMTVLILGAILASFGRSILSLDTAQVVLPGSEEGTSHQQENGPAPAPLFHPVEVNTDTVQDVIATLHRPDSYSREVTIERHWGENSSSSHIKSWVDGGFQHSRQILPSGAVRHEIIAEAQRYYWYDGSQRWLAAPAGEQNGDTSLRIPTYESVLELDPADITDAGYGLSGDYPCVFVEARDIDLGLTTRYWVSVDSGLLIAAEQSQDEKLVYRMSSTGPIQAPCPAGTDFSLPDGTLLHQVK